MLLVHKFQYKPDKVTNIILSSLTYASARLFNVGNYERHEYKNLGFFVTFSINSCVVQAFVTLHRPFPVIPSFFPRMGICSKIDTSAP